jgi:heterodisulfide reductase subunit A-like polyferredoxin
MPEHGIKFIEGELASVTLKPGDRLVIHTEQHLSREMAEMLKDQMEKWAPGVPCAVLSAGLKLGVVSASED